ncbi:hypothetical protein [Micromonospora sp. NPDC050200]|uniref:hypothetical protein n=1 Tax=Micromonospora sp. NPDC050200 TaxID=3155664 RepID=UPI0033DD266A
MVDAGATTIRSAVVCRRRNTAATELREPLPYLFVVVQEAALPARGQIDAVKKIEGPPDIVIIDDTVGPVIEPLSRPPIRLVTGTSAGEQSDEPRLDFFTCRQSPS